MPRPPSRRGVCGHRSSVPSHSTSYVFKVSDIPFQLETTAVQRVGNPRQSHRNTSTRPAICRLNLNAVDKALCVYIIDLDISAAIEAPTNGSLTVKMAMTHGLPLALVLLCVLNPQAHAGAIVKGTKIAYHGGQSYPAPASDYAPGVCSGEL
jgi:hypothetical protein